MKNLLISLVFLVGCVGSKSVVLKGHYQIKRGCVDSVAKAVVLYVNCDDSTFVFDTQNEFYKQIKEENINNPKQFHAAGVSDSAFYVNIVTGGRSGVAAIPFDKVKMFLK